MDIVGADIGNATTSVVSGGRVVFFPSFVAETRRAYQGGPMHHVTYEDQHYVIGEDALSVPGHDSLMADALQERDAYKRYLSARSFVAFLAGVSALYPDRERLDIGLGTGAPLGFYEAFAAPMIGRYQGDHVYAYQGRPRTLTVQTCRVFGEGRAALVLLTPEQLEGGVSLHDLGGRTYNVQNFMDGVPKGEGGSYDSGVDRMLHDMPHLVPTSPSARWEIQREMWADPKAYPDVRRELMTSIKRQLAIIEAKQRIDKASRHVTIGGGAHLAAPVIKAVYKKPVIVLGGNAPQSANAMAYWRLMGGA
jgi:hypothetical protein